MFQTASFTAIKNAVVERLEKAGAHLTYHNLAHTLDVTEEAGRIAFEEGVSEAESMLLQVAALYHDIGYLDGPQNHEERGCAQFRSETKTSHFSQEEIEKICGLIMATKVPQQPKNKLEEIICDADLDYLGRPDFLTLGDELKKEYLHFGILQNEADWDKIQIAFLTKHHYFTYSSRMLREPVKQRNLALLIEER